MRPVYSFTTQSGSHYRLEESPHTGALHLWQWSEIEGMSGFANVMYDIHTCPPYLEVGDEPLFWGTAPSGIRPGDFRIFTSPVVSVVHGAHEDLPQRIPG